MTERREADLLNKDLRAGSRQPPFLQGHPRPLHSGLEPPSLPGTQPELSLLHFCHTPYPSRACQIDTPFREVVELGSLGHLRQTGRSLGPCC